MPKRIIILAPNGVEVAVREPDPVYGWDYAVSEAFEALFVRIASENPKLGTYTVTVKEVK